ncbi:hypothetical protein BS47DRAFT_1340160 [Hydnum rufescens UP504]|uniref:Equilibrative nucleoside transporter n=1 Tax=Hydnum rufescens UP504 TaxID=1448309 RepID=A0A9P6DW59_9AGAM|nr:hypothetical protein BS47DRAFT_1340160 [Hydnum rufescens UP504]
MRIYSLIEIIALITATPYFLNKLEGSRYQSMFSSYLSVAYTATRIVFLGIATSSASTSSPSTRIRRSVVLLIILLFFLALSPILPFQGGRFFSFVIANDVIQSGVVAYLQTAVIGLAALFGPQALQSTFSGQAGLQWLYQYFNYCVLIAPSLPQGTKYGRSLALSAYLFFGISTGYMLLALVAHTLLVRTPAYQKVMEPFEEARRALREGETSQAIAASETDPLLSRYNRSRPVAKTSLWEIAKANIVYNVALACVLAITLSVFPPITSTILSVNPPSWDIITSPVMFISFHFLLFNTGDWFGRYLCSFPTLLVWSPWKLLWYSLLRSLFILVFLACNVSISASSPLLSTPLFGTRTPIVNSDLAYFAIVLAFGASNGYLASMGIIAASSLDHNEAVKEENVESAATVAQFCLIGGLFVGSMMSFWVRSIVCKCNPFIG